MVRTNSPPLPHPLSSSRRRGRGEAVKKARALRKNQTPWEYKLWQRLRARRFFRFRMKRQVRVTPYIVDFCCYEKRLVIELDGSYHTHPRKKDMDEKREKYLLQKGFRVLRFWNSEIDDNLEGVLERIFIFLTSE
ncbi:MAG: endonuclease domain-containing protein [bacterium]